jgi:hypothetical protein
MEVLQALNHELNGPQPSTQVSGKAESIPRSAAYAVAEVARMLGDAAHVIHAWEVDTAWLGVLAGDVDDLRRHVTEEHEARPVHRPPHFPIDSRSGARLTPEGQSPFCSIGVGG